MQTMVRLVFLLPILLAGSVRAADISVERADAMLAEMKVDPWEKLKDASVLAWNETPAIDGLLDLYLATEDAKYLQQFVDRADRILSHRDDKRGFKDHRGKSHSRWSIGTKYTVATGELVDAGGKVLASLKSLPAANNHMTKVTVSAGACADRFSLEVSNKAWKRVEHFEDLSLVADDARFIENVINTDTPIPKPPAGENDGRSLLLRVSAVKGAHTRPKDQHISLTPLWHAHIGYVGIIYHPMLKFARLVRSTPALSRFTRDADRYVVEAETSFADIREYFREGPAEGEGYYIASEIDGGMPYDGLPQPFNYAAKQACSEALLFELTHKPIYREHAVRIARLFKNRLTSVAETNTYSWKYWLEPFTTGWKRGETDSVHYPVHAPYDVTEDASHATLDIAMVHELARMGMVFEKVDVERLANTFLRKVAKPDRSGFNGYVDGTEGPREFQDAAVYGWLVLSDVNSHVYHVCREIYLNRGKDDFKSLARLLRYERLLADAD